MFASVVLVALQVVVSADSFAIEENSVQTKPKQTTQRSLSEISRQLSDLLREEATKRSSDDRYDVVVRMTQFYADVATDPRLPTSPTLDEYRMRMKSRLRAIQKEIITAEKKKADAERKRLGLSRGAVRQTAPLSNDAEAPPTTNEQGSTSSGKAGSSTSSYVVANDRGVNGGGTVRDNGAALVDLIQATIAPETWNVNGGPGAIYYYAPLHALVIRASSEVHQQVGGAVGQLRAAGR